MAVKWRKQLRKGAEATTSEAEFPKNGESGSGTEIAYSVEVRYNNARPAKFGEQIFDTRWQRLDFYMSPIGVPAANCLTAHASMIGLLPYQSAQALRWWFHAELEREALGDLCWESRLIEHQIKYSYVDQAVAAHEHFGGDAGERCTRRPPKSTNKSGDAG